MFKGLDIYVYNAKDDAKQTGSCGTVGLSHCRRVVADQLETAIGRYVTPRSPRDFYHL